MLCALRWFVALTLTAAALACGDTSGPEQVATVEVTGGGAALLPGQTVQLAATPRDRGGKTLTGRAVSWSTSNAAVATVSTGGLVQAVGAGTAAIEARVEGASGSLQISVNNPVPAVATVDPDTLLMGGAAVRLTITGTGFVPSSIALWNGQQRPTEFVNATSLGVSIAAADLTAAGRVPVLVRNPEPGGGSSASALIDVVHPVPAITGLSPEPAMAGTGAFELTVIGTGFVPGAVVKWNDQDRITTFINGTSLKATISAADVSAAGTATITVRNPAPGGGVSGSRPFAIHNPVPVVTGLSPDSALWGGAALQLTVTGTGFVQGAVVHWGGASRETEFVNANTVRANIAVGDIATPALVDVTVVNPAPGGGASGSTPFVVRIEPPGPALSVHQYATCAVRGNGEVWCWGYNDSYFQLGVGPTGPTVPTRVQSTLPFVSVAVGQMHACGLTRWGAAYCWGSSYAGALGTGNTASSYTPVAVQGGHAFVHLAAGRDHTCGVTAAGRLYCWGDNLSGQLGDGSGAAHTIPAEAGAGETWRRVYAGRDNTCALTAQQRLYCWGDGSDGKLGNGVAGHRAVPTPVSGSTLFTTATLGPFRTCAVALNGAAWCWGGFGLGNGTITGSLTPYPVSGGLTFTAISASLWTTCGLTSGGNTWCWGEGGSRGELGPGWTDRAVVPVRVNAPPLRAIANGEYHSCAITTAGGAVCWGERVHGALGDGESGLRASPLTVAGGSSGFTAVGVGLEFSCGLSGTSVRCWGNNAGGQLGDNTNTNRSAPVTVVGGHQFVELTVGLYHACGLTVTGAAYCWGYGSYGQLGNGVTQLSAPAPVAVAGGHVFAHVVARYTHSCGITTVGEIWCWGSNQKGQLGDGTTIARATPVPVAGLTGKKFRSLSLGGFTACGITDSGELYCWGQGAGLVGEGRSTDHLTPVRVDPGFPVASLTMGSHSCALDPAGAAYCWGWNGLGELGTGAPLRTTTLTPAPVAGGLTFRSIRASLVQTTCGVTTAGAGYCWGRNEWGQLGTGTLSMTGVPVQVEGNATYADIQPGNTHSCAVTAGGAVQCWGHLTFGELGIGVPGVNATPTPVHANLTFN